MGNENSQILSDATTPASEYSMDSEVVPQQQSFPIPARRRSTASNASTAQHSPMEPPEVDLSHLDEREREQIEAVIARAREIQEEETQRVRELEDEYTSYAASVVRRASLVGTEEVKEKNLCPICHVKEMGGDNQNACVDCERLVCADCGSYETSLQTMLQEWLCAMCHKRRKLVLTTGIWYHGGEELPIVKGAEANASGRPTLQRTASLPDDDSPSVRDRRPPRPPVYRQGSLPCSLETERDDRDDFGGDFGGGRSRGDSRSRQQPDGETPVLQQPRARGVGQSHRLDPGFNGAHAQNSLPSHYSPDGPRYSGSGDDISGQDDDPNRRKSPRPKHLVLSRQRSSSSTSDEDDHRNMDRTDGRDYNRDRPNSNNSHSRVQPDMKTEPRAGAEGAEAPVAKKSKPSPLDRVSMGDSHHEPERSKSPSRRSPRSPPRSPSWLRYNRESPPRSPPVRGMSPPKSPTARFPSTFVDRSSPPSREETYGEEYDNLPDSGIFQYDPRDMAFVAGAILDGRIIIQDKPPPKPARMSDQYDFSDLIQHEMPAHSLDLATYAATVASDTEHLTNMSVSPTNLPVPGMDHRGYAEMSPDLDSDQSPPSPNYYEEVDDIEIGEPTPKNIDYQGSKRQKIRPPATDWSPITDLSPILDVSPSVEKLEQDKMLAEQQKNTEETRRYDNTKGPPNGNDHPQTLQYRKDAPKSDAHSPLRRFQNFEDISSLGKPDSRSSEDKNHPETTSEKDFIHSIKPAKEISQEVEADKQMRLEGSKLQSQDRNNERSVVKQQPAHHHKEEREIDVDAEFIPQPSDQGKDSPSKRVRRTLPEPTPEIIATARKPPPVPAKPSKPQPRSKEQGVSESKNIPHQKHQADNKMNATNNKSKPEPLTIAKPETSPADTEPSPQYRVLKSPVSPRNAIHRDYSEPPKESPTPLNAEEKAYMYPSPETPPDPAASPPTPGSPSGPKPTPITTQPSSQVVKEVKKATKKISASPSPSPPTSIKGEKSQPSSPGSPNDKKVRRKLPPIPPGTESPSTPAKQRTKPGVSPKPAPPPKPVDKAAAEKELLRKRLQEKSAIQKKPPPVSAKASLSGKATKDEINTSRKPSAAVKTGPGKKATPAVTKKPIQISKKAQPTIAVRKAQAPPMATAGVRPVTTTARSSTATVTKATTKTPPPVKQKPKPAPKPAAAPKPPETVEIYGIKVPVEIKSLKQRIKEELQIVTATRRLRIDEMEAIRRMELELEERDKERRRKAELEAREEAIKKAEKQKQEELEREMQKVNDMLAAELTTERLYPAEKTNQRRKVSPQVANLTSRMSPQASPRRARHKRQNSDPMIAKFSPIEEDRDIEGELQYKLGLETRKVINDITKLSPRPSRHVKRLGTVTPPARPELETDPLMSRSSLSKSSEILSRYSLVERDPTLSGSLSESCLPMSASPRSRTPTYFSDDDDHKKKEEKKQQLRLEIRKRKQQIEENARLQYELRKMAQNVDITRREFEEATDMYQEHLRLRERPSSGIIRPIDYEFPGGLPEQYSKQEYVAYRAMLESQELALAQALAQGQPYPEPSYSSSEYLAHCRSDYSPKHDPSGMVPPLDAGQYMLSAYPDNNYVATSAHAPPYSQPEVTLYDSKPSSTYSVGYVGMQDPGMPTGTLPPVHQGVPKDMVGQYPEFSDASSIPTDAEATPNSERTPAMPLLEEVTTRSRCLLRDIGSRPLSDDMEKYFHAEDPLTTMFRVESEHSIADSDDNIMEGGVTIRQTIDQKKQPRPFPPAREYKFPTKRILLTRDPKDRSIKGNGIGMKIVGGKLVPGSDGEVGAYVAAIYPGGVAEQLHGELQEGDQVLEWNGVPLTGRTYEDVQQIIAVPNGEIELVVKPGAGLSSKDSTLTMSTRSDSCHSSYDNLDSPSDYDEYERYLDSQQGIDPDILAAQLEDIQGSMSPGASPSSSQQEMYLTPSVSMSSSEQTDTPSPSVEMPPASDKTHQYENREMGDIQLQFSYDDYDGTLNAHVIQAHNLQPKDTNGFSDPFVKVYLLPGRNPENKRRTKYIPRTLDPEWHQTLVFMGIPRSELSQKTLEVTVWDYDRFKPNDFLGEVLLDLSDDTFLDNKPHWYRLHEHDENNSANLPKPRTLSPPHSSSSSGTGHRPRPRQSGLSQSEHARREASPGRAKQKQLAPPNGQTSTKYSPGLGRRKSAGPSDSSTNHATSPPAELKSTLKSPPKRNHSTDVFQLPVSPPSSSSSSKELGSAPDNANTKFPFQQQRSPPFNVSSPSAFRPVSAPSYGSRISVFSSDTSFSFDSRLAMSPRDSLNNNTSPSSNPSSLEAEQDIFMQSWLELSHMLYSLGPGQVLPHVLDQAIQGKSGQRLSYQITGEILLGLKRFHDQLSVTVVHCRDLSQRIVSTTSEKDWYVKLYLRLPQTKTRCQKRKSSIHRCTVEPTFHEIFTYQADFTDVCLEASLWIDRGTFGQNKAVGLTTICLDDVDFSSQAGGEMFAYYKLLSHH